MGIIIEAPGNIWLIKKAESINFAPLKRNLPKPYAAKELIIKVSKAVHIAIKTVLPKYLAIIVLSNSSKYALIFKRSAYYP